MASASDVVMDAVYAGMEILSWEYSPSPRLVGAVDRLVAVDRPGTSLIVAGAAYGMFAVGGGLAVAGAPIAVGAAFALAGAALFPLGPEFVRRWRRRRRPTHTDVTRVCITSTGVAFGPYARLWTGKRERLARVWISRRAWTALQLEFRGTMGRRTTMQIPIPAHLEVGVIEAVATLKAKVDGTTAPAWERHMRLAQARRSGRRGSR